MLVGLLRLPHYAFEQTQHRVKASGGQVERLALVVTKKGILGHYSAFQLIVSSLKHPMDCGWYAIVRWSLRLSSLPNS